MNPDDTLIRDTDLRAELEAARGKPGFRDFALPSLISRQQRRDKDAAEAAARKAELELLPRDQRRRAIVRGVFENEAPSPADIRHIHSVLAVCGLPYSNMGAETRYERRQGNMSLVVKAGELLTTSGQWQQQPLPHGPKARLILMHLCSEAVRQNSATIEIADTFTAFVRELGFDDAGGPRGALTAFKKQLNALAACSLTLGTWDGTTAKTKHFSPIDEFQVWLSDNPDQRSLWASTLTFSPAMFESLKRHALPVNVHAVRAFAGSSRKLDFYFWVGYRLHGIERPLYLSWKALVEQFGIGFTRQRDFQRQFAEELSHITEVFPKLPVKLTENGLTLLPAGPDVLALPAPRATAKKR
jgi:hypothetical protein